MGLRVLSQQKWSICFRGIVLENVYSRMSYFMEPKTLASRVWEEVFELLGIYFG